MTSSLERLALAVEAAGADIAPTYAEYVQLAFAIATDCGEAGRGYFHRLCALSAKYQREHAERLFTEAMKSRRGDVHLGTAFRLAALEGVNVTVPLKAAAVYESPFAGSGSLGSLNQTPHTHTRTYVKEALPVDGNGEMVSGSEPLLRLPCFAQYDWPEPLRTIVAYGDTPAQKDILLLGGVTVLGATLSKKVRCFYGKRYLSPNLQTFIVAPSASGKGILSFLRQFAEPIHQKRRKEFEQKMAVYQKEKNIYDAAGKERANMDMPVRPQNRMFLFAGNNTGTGLLQNIMDADGEGLIFEVEADTLSAAIGSEYGRFSDTLRKCFDHDRISYNRRTDMEYREVEKTYLSMLVSGTPAQVRPLIPNAENGLFSRQIFYYMPAVHQWHDQFDENELDLEAEFKRLGNEWMAFLKRYNEVSFFTLKLSSEQQLVFNGRFGYLFRHAGMANDYEMNSSVVRLAIAICRIMSVVALLRGDMEPDPEIKPENIRDGICPRYVVHVTQGDFDAVLDLTEPLYHHANHILSFLPGTEVSRRTNSDRDSFFASLPPVFNRAMVREKAMMEGLNENTALTWLKRMVVQGKFVATGNSGEYRACVCEASGSVNQ